MQTLKLLLQRIMVTSTFTNFNKILRQAVKLVIAGIFTHRYSHRPYYYRHSTINFNGTRTFKPFLHSTIIILKQHNTGARTLASNGDYRLLREHLHQVPSAYTIPAVRLILMETRDSNYSGIQL
jgi:hypothetical protein